MQSGGALAALQGGRVLAGAPGGDGVRQRQRGRPSLAGPGLGAARSAAASALPGEVSGRRLRRRRVIYDPSRLRRRGGSGGSGLSPAAEGPIRGTATSDRPPAPRRRGRGLGRWRWGCGRGPACSPPPTPAPGVAGRG